MTEDLNDSSALSWVVPLLNRFHINKDWLIILQSVIHIVLYFSESCWLPMERHFMKKTEMVKQPVIVQ